jgi:branched-chain amino acid transport system substrate-binding protein
VIDTIKAGEWDTVLGKMAFDLKGDTKAIDYVVYRWDAKGGYEQIDKKGM